MTKLKRTKQCAKCPWKVSTNPYEIPNGYSCEQHKDLKDTIADGNNIGKPLKAMACHHSKDLAENAEYCVGWVYNQLGVGNNITLRMKMLRCENLKDLKVVGEQHDKFEDTLPK